MSENKERATALDASVAATSTDVPVDVPPRGATRELRGLGTVWTPKTAGLLQVKDVHASENRGSLKT